MYQTVFEGKGGPNPNLLIGGDWKPKRSSSSQSASPKTRVAGRNVHQQQGQRGSEDDRTLRRRGLGGRLCELELVCLQTQASWSRPGCRYLTPQVQMSSHERLERQGDWVV